MLLSIFILVAFIGPHFSFVKGGIEENRMVMEDGKFQRAPFAPSSKHLLGTDHDGRDLLSILIAGAKDTILLVFAITIIRYLFSLVLVLLAFIWKKPFTWLINWWNQLSAGLPIIFAAILFITLPIFTFSPNRIVWVIFILALIEVGRVSYIMKQKVLSISKTPFVEAGITIGNGPFRFFKNYYVPSLLPEIIVNFCIDLGRVALLLGQLGIFSIFVTQVFVQTSYGFGELRNTSLNWPTLLGEARGDLLKAFWIPFFTASAITYMILTFNILGEGLRRYFEKGESSNL
ncbi:ABC transporter permease subunit [Bacillus sp. ISL-35]|nr:ABC transporter permease subunit [Bacillus sp. ISL-35]